MDDLSTPTPPFSHLLYLLTHARTRTRAHARTHMRSIHAHARACEFLDDKFQQTLRDRDAAQGELVHELKAQMEQLATENNALRAEHTLLESEIGIVFTVNNNAQEHVAINHQLACIL